MGAEAKNRIPGEITLSHLQKRVLFHVLTRDFIDRTRMELRDRASKDMIIENEELRSLIKDLVEDIGIDVENYGPAESLIFMGFSDCFSSEKLRELAKSKPDSDTSHDREWSSNVREAAEYFLERRKSH